MEIKHYEINQLPQYNDGALEGIRPEDYRAGAESVIPFEARHSGDYLPHLVIGEKQHSRRGDSMSCVTFSEISALEVQEKILTGIEPNYSDRWTAVMSETMPTGNYFYRVADELRKSGVVHEAHYPTPESYTWEEYHTMIPNPPQDSLIAEGLDWLERWDVKYHWVDLKNQGAHWMKMAPLVGNLPGHAVLIVKIEGTTVTYFDSYKPYLKSVHVDAFKNYAIQLVLTPKIMSNTLILKDEASDLVVVGFPNNSEDAFKSMMANIGRPVPLKADGSIDWSKVKLDGTFRRN